MANNPYVNKVDKADGTTIMDITDTTAVEGDVETGKVFYKASGARSIGTGSGGTGKLDQIAAYEEYSASSTYDLDDVVAINSRIWKCTTAISTPEEWTESHWTETSIDEQKADRADVEEITNVCVEADVTIATTDWSNTSPYTYTWYNNAVGANSKIVVLLNDGAEAAGIDDFTYDKVTGGVQFTTDELPTGNLPLHIQIVEVVEMEAYDIDIPVTIATSAWSVTSPYTYTYTDARITDGCSVEVYFANGAENCDVRLLDYAKGTNSVTITADVLPAQSLPVIIHVENMEATGVAPLTASEVSTDAVTGQTTVQGALSALVSGKADKVSGATSGNIAKLDSNGNLADSGFTLGVSVPSDAVFTDTVTTIVNNLTSDSTTSALSAAQGKALNGKLSVSSLTECASLDAVKTYLSGVIATMNVRESRVIGIITRFTDSGFINGGYYEGNIYYISNNLNGFYAGVLYSITNADFINFTNNNGTWTFNSVNSNKLPATSYSSYAPVTLGNYTAINNGFLMIQTWVNASKTLTVKVGNTKLFEHFCGSAMNATAQIPVKAGTTVSITTDDSISSSAEIGKFVAT